MEAQQQLSCHYVCFFMLSEYLANNRLRPWKKRCLYIDATTEMQDGKAIRPSNDRPQSFFRVFTLVGRHPHRLKFGK